MEENFKKYLVEFIGTFFLVFTVGSTTLLGAEIIIAPIVIGFVLMAMVYAGGHISGGHYNPAVSLAAVLAGGMDRKKLAQYWLAQFLGGLLGAYFVKCLLTTLNDSVCPYTFQQIMLGEFLFTFALCYVVLQTALSEKNAGNQYYGLAIGATLMVGAYAVGGILCFGAFNPAVAISLGALDVTCWACVGVTVFVNLIAAFVAAMTYKFINK